MAELANRPELIADFQDKLEKLNRKQAAEFRRLLGAPPSADNVPSSFWDRVRRENEDEVAAALLLIFMTSYDAHRTWGDMEPPRDNSRRDTIAEKWTTKRAKTVATELVAHSVDMLDTTGKAWSIKTAKGIEIPKQDIDELITKIFGEGRAKSIAFTETSQGMVNGGEAGVRHAGKKITAYWCHSTFRPRGHSHAARQPCKICTRLEGKPEGQWEGFRPGEAHPNCDCFPGYIDEDGYMIGTDNLGLVPGNVPGRPPWKFLPY